MASRVWLLVATTVLATAVPARAQTASGSPTIWFDLRSIDSLTSGGRVAGELLGRLPIDDPRHALTLVPGVALTNGDIGVATAPELSIRAGRRGQANVYVDGAPIRFQTLGTSGIGLAPNAIAAAAVVTGVAPVYIGDAGGGVIAYATRGGSDKLAGDVRWDSDEPFGNGSTVGYNRIEGTLGGPLPGVANLTFFVSATLQGQRSSYRGAGAAAVPTYLPAGLDTTLQIPDLSGNVVSAYLLRFAQWSGECDPASNFGVECQGLRRPLDWSTARRGQARVEYRYGAASLVSVTAFGGDLQQRFFPGRFAFNPAMYAGRRAWSAAAIVNWRHDLGRLRDGPLALDVNLSLVANRDGSGPLATASEVATRDPYLGMTFSRLEFTGLGLLNLPGNDQLVHDIRTNSGTRGVPYFGLVPDPTQRGRLNPYALSDNGWWTDGITGTLSDVYERRLQGRWALDWRPVPAHRITAGVDADRTNLTSYTTASLSRQVGLDAFLAHPSRFGVFVGDQLDLGSVVGGRGGAIDIGLRYDRFNPGGELPNVPAYISSSGPALWNPSAATDDTAYANSVARVFGATHAQGFLSPRLRFAQAVGRSTSLRLGYSRTVEPPAWETLFSNSNSDLSFTNVNESFGRDIDFVVSSLVEVGVRSVLGQHATVDVVFYRKDLPDYVNRIQAFSDPRDTTRITSINVVTPFEDAHAQGVDVGLAWQGGGWLTATAVYSLTRTYGESPAPAPDITAHAVGVSAEARVPDDWKAGTTLGAVGRGLNATLLLRVASGAPFTRLQNNGNGTIAPGGGGGAPAEPLNASRLPWTKRLDMRIAKSVRAGGRDWSVFVDARNVLNIRNIVSLFAETGGVVNATHRQQTIGDPTFGTGEYGALWNEANNAGALGPGQTVDLTACATWGSPLNCVALTRVERRFGDGNGLYSLAEQQRAFNAFYDDFFGTWRFYGSGRTLRVGAEIKL